MRVVATGPVEIRLRLRGCAERQGQERDSCNGRRNDVRRETRKISERAKDKHANMTFRNQKSRSGCDTVPLYSNPAFLYRG